MTGWTFLWLPSVGSTLHCGARTYRGGPSCGVARALGAWGFSRCSSWAREPRFNSCGATKLLPGMWDLPWQGIESVSHVLASRFFTSEPPGNSYLHFFFFFFLKFLQRLIGCLPTFCLAYTCVCFHPPHLSWILLYVFSCGKPFLLAFRLFS